MPTNFDDPNFDEFAGSSVAVEEAPSFDNAAWEERGMELAKKDHDVRFALGDWLNEGEPHHPDFSGIPGAPPGLGFYALAERITGLANGSLRDLASTAARVATSVRTDKLSWSHHRVLINARPKADEAELKGWLEKAAENHWSVAELREELHPSEDAVLEKSILVKVPVIIFDALKEMAADPPDEEEDVDLTVQQYAAKKLIEFVKSEEGEQTRESAKQRTATRLLKQQQKNGRRLHRTHPGKPFGSR
jgi:hypothetical protein